MNKAKQRIKVRPVFYAYCFEGLKEVAEFHGYNLLLNGSLHRDLDLVLIPWISEVSSIDEVINEFATCLRGEVVHQSYGEKKCFPHGRESRLINLNRGGHWNGYHDESYYLDISVFPNKEV